MPVRLSVLLLALLGAGVASAQEPAPAPTLPPPPLVSAPEEDVPLAPAPVARAEPSDAPVRGGVSLRAEADARFVPRVSLEVLGGTAGGFVGGGAGFLTGLALGAATVGCGSFECLISGIVGGLVGVMLGVPAGTYLGARLVDGRGTFSAAMAGSLIGWGAAGLGFGLLSGTQAGDSEVLSVALLSLPVLGSSVAYELSHTSHLLPQAPRVVPVAGFTPSGAKLGLAGRF